MSFAEDMHPDDVTGRTKAAQDAEREALKAQTAAHRAQTKADDVELGFIGYKRHAARIHWVWGVFAFLIGVAGVGYVARDRIEHFQTKEAAAQDHEELERLRMWQKAVDAHEQSRDDTMTRMSNQIDDIHRYFMRGK